MDQFLIMDNILSIGGGENPATFKLMAFSKRARYSNKTVTCSNRTVMVIFSSNFIILSVLT